MDTERLAERLFSRSKRAVEVDPAQFQEMFDRAEPGWTPIEEPENYRWFLIKDFPVKDFRVTLNSIIRNMDESGDPDQERAQHDEIVELLEGGAVEWPAFVASSGVILDGYHRIAAHRTLEDKDMDVVVAVERPGSFGADRGFNKSWNEAFPR